MAGPDLISFLRSVQEECEGVIPFERFMSEALYHPHFGYYSNHIKDVGRAGDFSTSATLGDALGAAIASWITRRAEELAWKHIPVIEIGAGNGSLAQSVLKHLPWRTRWRTDYMIHETSPILREKQKRSLRWKGVRWIDSLSLTLDQLQGRTLIFSNELVDAFPCRLFVRAEKSWEELGLRIEQDGSLREMVLDRTYAKDSFSSPDHLFPHLPAPVGQRIERHDSYHAWMREWALHWHSGSMLTIDYGDTAEKLYERRQEGSLRAYWKHNRYTGRDLYARFGKQDLTADINFSDLISWGEALGWKKRLYTTQRQFMADYLPKDSTQIPSQVASTISAGGTSPMTSSAMTTSIPDNAGDAFKILDQQPATQ